MRDVMLDLESFGNGKYACICQIGAAYFDLKTGEVGQTFKINVKGEGEFDIDTVTWWLSQDKTAQESLLKKPRFDELTAMNMTNNFLSDATKIWSHATFDFVVLTERFRQLKINPSFSYKSARDIRTLVSLAEFTVNKVERTGTHHDALDDCLHQIKYCHEAYKKLFNLK